jgi:hypothetical protein
MALLKQWPCTHKHHSLPLIYWWYIFNILWTFTIYNYYYSATKLIYCDSSNILWILTIYNYYYKFFKFWVKAPKILRPDIVALLTCVWSCGGRAYVRLKWAANSFTFLMILHVQNRDKKNKIFKRKETQKKLNMVIVN